MAVPNSESRYHHFLKLWHYSPQCTFSSLVIPLAMCCGKFEVANHRSTVNSPVMLPRESQCLLGIGMIKQWQTWARQLKREIHAVCLASRDSRVPWYSKLLAACVVAYLFSPIDLIPDFIPVVGYLDGLIILPVGLTLVIRLIPPEIMNEHRETVRICGLKRKPIESERH